MLNADMPENCLRGHCPKCGRGKIARSYFRIREACEVCHFQFLRGEGFFLGAMVVSYGIFVFGVLPVLIALWILDVLSGNAALILGVAGSIVFPVILYPLSWYLWLYLFFTFIPSQMDTDDELKA